jgi:hypothetical protein
VKKPKAGQIDIPGRRRRLPVGSVELEEISACSCLVQARELAMLICSSEEAIETFIAHCDVAARDLLLPYGDVVMTLSIVLRIKRTLDSDEIDKIIADLQARNALAVERGRRKRWQRVVESAASFTHEGNSEAGSNLIRLPQPTINLSGPFRSFFPAIILALSSRFCQRIAQIKKGQRQ